MSRLLIAASLATAMLASTSVNAADLNYSFVEGGYVLLDGHGEPDAEGLGINGSVELGGNTFLFGGYSSSDHDRLDVDIDSWRIGLGFHHGLSETHDLVVSANYLQTRAEGSGIRFKLHGYEAELGLRSAWHPNFETTVAIGHQNGHNFDADTYLRASAQYKFNANWGLVASATHRDGFNEYLLGPRLSF